MKPRLTNYIHIIASIESVRNFVSFLGFLLREKPFTISSTMTSPIPIVAGIKRTYQKIIDDVLAQ
jgi:hypothetical protein